MWFVYLWCSVRHTLQDPVYGGRIERQIDGNLHPLQRQLILNTVAVNLTEGGQQVEEVLIQTVLQVRSNLHPHLTEEHHASIRRLAWNV